MGGVGVAELAGGDMASADLLGCGHQGLLDVDKGDHVGTRLAFAKPKLAALESGG